MSSQYQPTKSAYKSGPKQVANEGLAKALQPTGASAGSGVKGNTQPKLNITHINQIRKVATQASAQNPHVEALLKVDQLDDLKGMVHAVNSKLDYVINSMDKLVGDLAQRQFETRQAALYPTFPVAKAPAYPMPAPPM